MSQHTYTLKFTIGIDNPEGGSYPIHSGTREVKPELLTQVIGPDSATKEDIIKAEVEKKIKEAIPTQKGIITVNFDSLTES